MTLRQKIFGLYIKSLLKGRRVYLFLDKNTIKRIGLKDKECFKELYNFTVHESVEGNYILLQGGLGRKTEYIDKKRLEKFYVK